ncbi:hypothetical protein AAMO2058_000620500 [Amorphochlora amoebiformis]
MASVGSLAALMLVLFSIILEVSAVSSRIPCGKENSLNFRGLRGSVKGHAVDVTRRLGSWRRARLVAARATDWKDVEDNGAECSTNLFHLEKTQEMTKSKNEILSLVASLDRGLAASPDDAVKVDDMALNLERDNAVDFVSPEAMSKLKGKWRLVYSSGFTTGSLGGTRPGPLAAITPLRLGPVFQIIDDKELINQVDLSSFFLSAPDGFAATLARIPGSANWQQDSKYTSKAPSLRASLSHSYNVESPDIVTITFQSTTVKPVGSIAGMFRLDGLPEIALPELPDGLKPPGELRSASFKVTYLDSDFRITRGDRGELRIYTLDNPLR